MNFSLKLMQYAQFDLNKVGIGYKTGLIELLIPDGSIFLEN